MAHPPPKVLKGGPGFKPLRGQEKKDAKRRLRRDKPPNFLVRRGISLQPKNENFNKRFLEAQGIAAASFLAPGLSPKEFKAFQSSRVRPDGQRSQANTDPNNPNAFGGDQRREDARKRARRLAASLEGLSLGVTPQGLRERGVTLLSEHLRLG